jgi:hybrid cluster-associated redox disulfide protein
MITKEMHINQILDMGEEMSQILLSYGLYCQGCPGAEAETLEEAANGHHVNFNKLLADLNSLLEK